MHAERPRNFEERDSLTRKAVKSAAVASLVRGLGLGMLVALGGLLVGLGIMRATNVFRLIPQDGPQIWVKSGCRFAEAAVRAALHAAPERPVFLIPLDQGSDVTKSACRSTLAALDNDGYWWLRYFPERWLCQRFAEGANEHLVEPVPIPTFYAGGQLICNGLCEGVFERIDRPELQQFVTVFRPSEGS